MYCYECDGIGGQSAELYTIWNVAEQEGGAVTAPDALNEMDLLFPPSSLQMALSSEMAATNRRIQ